MIVSINVPVMEISPCLTGSLVFAAAAAIGAEPRPDSLEKIPLAIPFFMEMRTAPRAPPAIAFAPNALVTTSAIAAGSFVMLQMISTTTVRTYRIAMKGTTT